LNRAFGWLPILGFLNVSVVLFIVLYKGVKLKPIGVSIGVAIAGGIVTGIFLFFYSKVKKSKLNTAVMNPEEL